MHNFFQMNFVLHKTFALSLTIELICFDRKNWFDLIFTFFLWEIFFDVNKSFLTWKKWEFFFTSKETFYIKETSLNKFSSIHPRKKKSFGNKCSGLPEIPWYFAPALSYFQTNFSIHNTVTLSWMVDLICFDGKKITWFNFYPFSLRHIFLM